MDKLTTISWIIVLIISWDYLLQYVSGFQQPVCPLNNNRYSIQYQPLHMVHINESTEENNIGDTIHYESNRRRCLQSIFYATTILSLTFPVNAAAIPTTTTTTEDTIWITGKMPIAPGQKPKDKNDLTGTRKDPNFLRSLSDCKNQCENMMGSNDGYAKGKNECLSECQDICCTTYQQCTFPIVQRI
jgi:hypothetical protein